MNAEHGTTPWLRIVGLALLFTLLNCVKPLHMDDTDFYSVAAQLAKAPLDPYGFTTVNGQPANRVCAPPVLPYWWSIAIRAFGDHPVLWKLWLFPIALLFVFSLDFLLRRVAAGFAGPFLFVTVLSPTFLPSFNLMLDVPALALTLSALVLFIRGIERGSTAMALAAGLLAGLAMQTKYTGFVAPALIGLYALLHRRLALGVIAGSLVLAMFVGWEAWLVGKYGESHFVNSMFFFHQTSLLALKARLVLPMLGTLGGLAVAPLLLGLIALGVSRRRVLFAAVLALCGYLLVCFVPEGQSKLGIGGRGVDLSALVFGGLGVAYWIVVVWVGWRLVRQAAESRLSLRERTFFRGAKDDSPPASGTDSTSRRLDWFLVLWLGLELTGYFGLSPFPAVRRLMGLVVITTLLVARQASRSSLGRERMALVRGAAVVGAALGLAVYLVDLRDAWAQKEAVERAVTWVRGAEPDAPISYLGGWGFDYYARESKLTWGLEATPPGDRDHWLIVDSAFPWFLDSLSDRGVPLERVTELRVDDFPHVTTIRNYYAGRKVLGRYDGPRGAVAIYRVPARRSAARAPVP